MIYTKTGDKGQTSLASGQRVAKTDARIEAYGTVDELNSWIGALRVVAEDEQLEWIQNKLFNLGAELSEAPGEWIVEKDVKQLESGIDEMELKKRYIEYLRTSIKKMDVLSDNVNLDEEYEPDEDAIYNQLKDAIAPAQGKRKTVIGSIRGMTLQKIKKDKKNTGTSGEAKILGVAGPHSYVINGVTTKTVTIGGRPLERKFVEIHNPWHNNYIRLYDKNTLKPFVRKSDKKKDGTKIDNKGMFLMELRDFIETFQGFNVEE